MHKHLKTVMFFLCTMYLITVNVVAMPTSASCAMHVASMSSSSVSTSGACASASSAPACISTSDATDVKAEQKRALPDGLTAAVCARDWQRVNQVYPLPFYKNDVTRNLILIINTEKVPEIDLCVTMLALAVHSQAAPIIVSGTVLQSFLQIQRKKCFRGVIDALGRTKGSWHFDDGKNPLPTKLPKELPCEAVAIGLIPFTEQDWYGYINKQRDFVLLIPKRYVVPASTRSPASICGFNDKNLDQLDFKTPQVKEPGFELPTKGLISMFETALPRTQSNATQRAEPTWKIYWVGHGLPATCEHDAFAGNSALIAGLMFEYFVEFIGFLSTALPVDFVHYISCYSGGRNQAFVNQVLRIIDPSFPIVSCGSGDLGMSISSLGSSTDGMRIDSDGSGRIQLSSPYSFATYFALLNAYFLEPQRLVTIANDFGLGELDPLAVATYGLMDPKKLIDRNVQPFIRKPKRPTFEALAITKDTVILTNESLAAYKQAKQPIDARAASVLVVEPKVIAVPLLVGQDTAFISRVPVEVKCSKDAAPAALLSGEALSVATSFEAGQHYSSLTAVDVALWRLISNMIRCNGAYKSSFTIDTLSCKNYADSGLETKDAVLQAQNVTIDVKGIKETSGYGDWGVPIYPGTITIALSIGQTRYAATWNRNDLHANIKSADGLRFVVQRS